MEYDGQSLPLERIWKAWLKGKRYVQLKDGSYASLPESWLEKLAHTIDPTCFMIVSHVTEVSGRGFSLDKNYQ